ncbi:FMN-binding glutamate synthase family protein [Metabacillus sp. GX 13764]|uniref:FMN-binding glutamate synthase family protein n=1 Tax=Metabacillus kandeliae TaxID=2900151 RepID=UPI001E3232A3|nr:FMN-binding glutamate synthase family protein [Metabacillus kandeliae]MCD7035108.1 FMN-binding glutamate synthase family protein [Metabacillus kandeliae]
MSIADWAALVLLCLLIIPIVGILFLTGWFLFRHERQQEHAILRNYPVLGKMRYIIEKMGPELRQYLYNNDNEGKPFSRRDYLNVVLAGKYNSRSMGFGSERNFEEGGYFINNAMFPKQRAELKIRQEPQIDTRLYHIDKEKLFNRREHGETAVIKPFYLAEEHEVVIGESTARQPFRVKGLVGQSAMSYGALGDHAITALSKGLGMAGGTWMNTGEGGLSSFHLEGSPDIICQIGPGLFGVRDKDGNFSHEEFKKKSDIPEIKAFELKLAQGAKVRGGHLEGQKVNEEIAKIRNVEPWKTVDSPNRFEHLPDADSLLNFVDELRDLGGKPVGIKIVVGNRGDLEHLFARMKERNVHPDFITVYGGEGGTGASFQELADSTGLPIHQALPIVHETLIKYGIRDRVKIFASGKLLTPDKIAVALALGADLVNIARGMMFSVGCIMAQVCHTNNCPVGVATTDPKLQKALSIEEKKYRVCNYVVSLREGLFNLAAAAGLESPVQFEAKHISLLNEAGKLKELEPAKS